MQGARRLDQVAQRAVDAQPHHRARFERLDMDVGSALAQRLGQQRIDQADQRRVVPRIEQILDSRYLLQQPRQVDVLREIAGEPRRRRARAVVSRGNELVELARLDPPRTQRHAEHAAQLGQRAGVRPAAQRHGRKIALQ